MNKINHISVNIESKKADHIKETPKLVVFYGY